MMIEALLEGAVECQMADSLKVRETVASGHRALSRTTAELEDTLHLVHVGRALKDWFAAIHFSEHAAVEMCKYV